MVVVVEHLEMMKAAIELLTHDDGNQTTIVSVDIEGVSPTPQMVESYNRHVNEGKPYRSLDWWSAQTEQLLDDEQLKGTRPHTKVRTIQIGTPRGIVVVFDVMAFEKGKVPKALMEFLNSDVTKIFWDASADATMWRNTFRDKWPEGKVFDLQAAMSPAGSKLRLKEQLQLYTGAPPAGKQPQGAQLLRPLRKKFERGGVVDSEDGFRTFLKYATQDVILHALMVANHVRPELDPEVALNAGQAFEILRLALPRNYQQSTKVGYDCSKKADDIYKGRIQRSYKALVAYWESREGNCERKNTSCLYQIDGMQLHPLRTEDLNKWVRLFSPGQQALERADRFESFMRDIEPGLNRDEFPREILDLSDWSQRQGRCLHESAKRVKSDNDPSHHQGTPGTSTSSTGPIMWNQMKIRTTLGPVKVRRHNRQKNGMNGNGSK